MLKFLRLAVPLAIVAGTAVVLACGPDFPAQLLDDRAGTLRGTPGNSFAFEAAHLLDTAGNADGKPPFRPNESDAAKTPDALPLSDVAVGQSASATPAEYQGLTPTQIQTIKNMRAQPDGDAAYAIGASLPAALRLYTAGAVDYRISLAGIGDASVSAGRPPQQQQKSGDRARQRFLAVLALPPAEGAARAAWAAYMLGQAAAQAIGTAATPLPALRDKAGRAYALVRSRIAGGAPDPAGLAVASFGEQARLYLAHGNDLCTYRDLADRTACADSIAAADFRQAIHLYAQQAACGSGSALQSLRRIAEWALSTPARAGRLIDDPVAQNLLVTYTLARVGDVANDDPATASDYTVGATTSGYPDAARDRRRFRPHPAIASLAAALQARGITRIAAADRVAALAYRAGRYDLAQSLVDAQRSALSSWVRAKLALRKGDMAAAAAAYADAAKAFPASDSTLEPAAATLLEAERGVLMLSRGQYVDAFGQLYAATAKTWDGAQTYAAYYSDMAYVAERVLTTGELQAAIDRDMPATPMPAAAERTLATGETIDTWRARHPRQLADVLRQLLARRLVRERRIDQALRYFPDDADLRYAPTEQADDGNSTPATWRMRQTAQQYGAALHDGEHAWLAATRAQGYYTAATLARQRGMEIMGYEQAPDFAQFDGAFDYGSGRGAAPAGLALQPAAASGRQDTTAGDKGAYLSGPYVADEEKRRFAATAAVPDRRFFYRDAAADLIMKSADQLPARSQAFAAVLCKGTGLSIADVTRTAALYRRYIRQGAAVPFAADFGRHCAAPDFSGATRFPYVQAWKAARHRIAHHRAIAGVALLVALLSIALSIATVVRRVGTRRSAAQARSAEK